MRTNKIAVGKMWRLLDKYHEAHELTQLAKSPAGQDSTMEHSADSNDVEVFEASAQWTLYQRNQPSKTSNKNAKKH